MLYNPERNTFQYCSMPFIWVFCSANNTQQQLISSWQRRGGWGNYRVTYLDEPFPLQS